MRPENRRLRRHQSRRPTGSVYPREARADPVIIGDDRSLVCHGRVGRAFEMTIGVLQLEIGIGDAMSLKDKRRVVKSLKDRIAHGHNVSIAEVGALDQHRRAIIGIAMVANDARYVEGALSKIVDFVRRIPAVDLMDYQIELM